MASIEQLYSDLDLNLTPHPVTGDILVRTGEAAITQSLKNLVLTNFFERPFHWDLGGNVRARLFENVGPITSKLTDMYIRRVIGNDEPRAVLTRLFIDTVADSNEMRVRIVYQPRHLTQPVVVDLFLGRVR